MRFTEILDEGKKKKRKKAKKKINKPEQLPVYGMPYYKGFVIPGYWGWGGGGWHHHHDDDKDDAPNEESPQDGGDFGGDGSGGDS